MGRTRREPIGGLVYCNQERHGSARERGAEMGSKTFEERVGEELDALYSGALFLCGGGQECAGRIVVDAVTEAAASPAEHSDSAAFRRWLEGLLVKAVVSDANSTDGGPPTEGTDLAGVGADLLGTIESRHLLHAARSIPPLPRSALWLVLLQRWSYDEAEAVLGVDRDGLRTLLSYRSVFLREAISRAAAGGAREAKS